MENRNFPFEVKELEPNEKAEIARLYQSTEIDFVRLAPKGYVVLRRFLLDAANIYNLAVRPSDIFVNTYQRSGTTLTQELVWLLANDLDYETAKKVPLPVRYPFLEIFMFYDDKWKEKIMSAAEDKKTASIVMDVTSNPQSSKVAVAPSPRFIKTHLPFSLLPHNLLDTSKLVYVARDPRDVVVSSYHHAKLFKILDFPSSFRDFWNLFIKGLFPLAPYFMHLKEAWERRHHPNMLFLFYEELTQQMPVAIRRVAKFLGKKVTDEEVATLTEHLKVDNFKKNEAVNFEQARKIGVLASNETFIRKGKVGDWRDYFDEEMTREAQRWMENNLRDTDLRFPHIPMSI